MTKRFVDDVFFPTLDNEGITTILHLGDLVDKRKQISYLTARRLREDFLNKIAARQDCRALLIAGNHDTYFKNTNSVNALTELVEGNYPNIDVHIDPTEVVLNGEQILLLPWICDENREQSFKLLNQTRSQICMGHLEIQGFEMYRGSVSTHGEQRELFQKFDLTFSGHFHHRSSDSGIIYVGSHGEFTWSDYDDPRGFHVLDLKTRELTFHRNPHTMFRKVWYNDTEKTLDQILKIDESQVAGRFLKLIVQKKNNPYWFDMLCEKLDKAGPIGMQIVEDHLNLNLEDDESIVSEAESTLDVFKKHISQIQAPNLNRAKLEKLITELYNQALTVET